MFAVIKTGGKQYRVAPDLVMEIEKLPGTAGELVEFDQILMVGGDDGVRIGAPLVEGAKVTAELVETARGRKVISFKKRRRQNSKRIRGHRQWLSTVRILEILTDGAKPKRKPGDRKAEEKAAKDASKEQAPAAEEEGKVSQAAEQSVQAGQPEQARPAPLFSAPEGPEDDLTRIKGIGPVAKRQLNEQGIKTFAQLAALSEDDISRIDENMPFSADQIRDWRGQAAKLADSKD